MEREREREREKENEKENIYIERVKIPFILKNWLTKLWRLASPESAGWASRLET